MVNIRNLDPDVWRRFGSAARQRRVPIGQLLTSVLRDWLKTSDSSQPSRQDRAAAAAGMFRRYQPERDLSAELLADRQTEAAAE